MDEFKYLNLHLNKLKPAFDFKKANPNSGSNLIITYGPPASGKSFYTKELLKENIDSYVQLVVDDIVESFDEYQKDIIPIKRTLQTDQIINSVISHKDFLQDMESIEHLNQLAKNTPYFKYRSYANKINDVLLNICLTYGLNIIFETTGGSSISIEWLLNNIIKDAKNKNYKVTVIYPYVNDLYALQQVAIKRSIAIGRLPSLDVIKDIYTNAQKNVKQLIESTYVDEVHIYKQVYEPQLILLFSKEINVTFNCDKELDRFELGKQIGQYCKMPIKYSY